MIKHAKFNQKIRGTAEIESRYSDGLLNIKYKERRIKALLRACDNQAKYMERVYVFLYIRKLLFCQSPELCRDTFNLGRGFDHLTNYSY